MQRCGGVTGWLAGQGVAVSSRRGYPCHLTDVQWDLVKDLLSELRGRPAEKHPRCGIVNAIRYPVRSGLSVAVPAGGSA
jgi:hypothetical protein